MSDQPPRRTDAGDEPFGRPLPDDGLADTMPDWLRRPPAWHGAAPTLPAELPPDTSTIDPNTLIDVEDLPLWLQRIAQRGGEPKALTPALRATPLPMLGEGTSSPSPSIGRGGWGVRDVGERAVQSEPAAEEGNHVTSPPRVATQPIYSASPNEESSPWWPIVLALLVLLALIGLAVIAAVYLDA